MSQRKIQTSVTNFLYCGDEYLFIKRNMTRKIDPGLLNGIGGKVEQGENYLDAAIRETEEETGYKVKTKDIQLSAVVRLEGGYKDDWVMCFFKIKVANKKIPIGHNNHEGELLWLSPSQVMSGQYDLVDDLNYCFKEIVEGKKTLFMNAKLNRQHKITKVNKNFL